MVHQVGQWLQHRYLISSAFELSLADAVLEDLAFIDKGHESSEATRVLLLRFSGSILSAFLPTLLVIEDSEQRKVILSLLEMTLTEFLA